MERFLLSGTDWTMKEFLGEDWVWRNAHRRETRDVRWWKPGSVPSSVTGDLLRCGAIPDPFFEANSLQLEWISQRTWVYRKTFRLPESMRGQRLRLVFGGVDYACLVYVNDVLATEHEGMFPSFSCDVTDLIDPEGENLVAVVIQRAPDEEPQVSKTRYVKTHKSRMTYWWDFCPRMVHLGIWKDMWLEAVSEGDLRGLQLRSTVSASLDKGELEVLAETKLYADEPLELRAEAWLGDTLAASHAEPAKAGKVSVVLPIDKPELWWPSEYGDQPLYLVKLSLWKGEECVCSREARTGLRRLEWIANEGASADARPYTVRVNNRTIYLKGWNWVPYDVLYGDLNRDRLTYLLTLVKKAHCNCLRVWGGGLIEREEFYDLCDELGIFVWQEFIQSSSGIENKPSEEPAFLELMDREARQIIPEKTRHPSLAVWGGGNELQSEGGSMISPDEPVIRVLRRAVEELDPGRYFLESSPTGRVFNNTLRDIAEHPDGMHDVHGPWEHQGLTEQYTLYNSGASLFSSEFGVEGMTNLATLLRGMDKSHLWPPSRDNFLYFHRGSWWNNFPLMQEMFEDRLTCVEEAVPASQLMQYEGLKYAVEANRRRALHASGTFPWQFNEPYPNNTCTCSVDYYGLPKPAYYGVARAYGFSTATASFDSQTIAGKDAFAAKIWFQTSAPAAQARITARLADARGAVLAEASFEAAAGGEKAALAGEFSCSAEKIGTPLFFLILSGEADGAPLPENRYLFTKTTLAPLLDLEKPRLSLSVESGARPGAWTAVLKNEGASVAAGVKLEDAREPDNRSFLIFDENYFYLLPGEEKRVTVTAFGDAAPALRLTGFGL